MGVDVRPPSRPVEGAGEPLREHGLLDRLLRKSSQNVASAAFAVVPARAAIPETRTKVRALALVMGILVAPLRESQTMLDLEPA
jgi:hypothetical protein